MTNVNSTLLIDEYVVYIHTNITNNKKYIGITSYENPKRRWKGGSGYKNQPYFYNAIKKYGWDNFINEIIDKGLSKNEAESMEIELISKYNTTNKEFGYNLSNGGAKYGKHSDETKMKISMIRKGIIFSDEHRKNLSKAHKNIIQTPEQNYKNMMSNPRRKPVICVETQMVYASIRDAGRNTNISFKLIAAICNKKYGRKTAGGYHWKYYMKG